VEETAEVLKVSEETILRDWRLAKMWLLHELSGERRDGA
jgi:ECF sigma factor